MTIFVRPSHEPWTEASWNEPPILAESDAYRLLRREMERYVRGEVQGRSYLVSGHRGSGKTTLVLKAVQDVSRELDREGRRPLLVKIQGPELLAAPPPGSPSEPAQNKDDARPKAPTEEPSPKNDGEKTKKNEPKPRVEAEEPAAYPLAEAALRRITLGIYRALCGEISRSYERAAVEPRSRRPGLPAIELAAELRLALDSAPEPAELRELWHRIDRLEAGVLFRTTPRPGQGLRELVALASAAQAYRKLLGKGAHKTTDSDSKSEQQSTTTQKHTGDVVKTLSTLIAAAAAGLGIALVEPLAGWTAAAVALLGGWSYEWQSIRSSKRSRSEEYVFILDTSLGTLERELPILVDRLRHARLAPIFVIDELDKVDGLTSAMHEVVSRLKQFVAEGAFFCFLTDRDYFESLRRRLGAEPYPKEYTYFHDRLLVGLRPEDLREYLYRRMEAPSDEKDDLTVLTYVLPHRACMHAVDLNRELRRLLHEDDFTGRPVLDLPTGEIRSKNGPRLETFVQVAVETVLAEKEVRERLENDPGFLQVALDAVYFPTRQWREGDTYFNASYNAFCGYLAKRMRPNEPSEPKATEEESKPEAATRLPKNDVRELYRMASAVIGYLADLGRLLDKHRSPTPPLELPRVITDMLEELESQSTVLLSAVDKKPDHYRWCFDPFGQEVQRRRKDKGEKDPGEKGPETEDAETQDTTGDQSALSVLAGTRSVTGPSVDDEPSHGDEPKADWSAIKRRLTDLNAALFDRTERIDLESLGSELGLLSRSPSWLTVREALGPLEEYSISQEPYEELDEHARMVEAYMDMLHERLPLVWKVYYYTGIALEEDGRHDKAELDLALQCFMALLRHGDEAGSRSLLQVFENFENTVPEPLRTSLQLEEQGSLLEPTIWTETLDHLIQGRRSLKPPIGQDLQTVLELWSRRLKPFLLRGIDDFEPSWSDLACFTAGAGPGEPALTPLDRVGLYAWSNISRRIFGLLQPGRQEPAWLHIAAMARLGFGAEDEIFGGPPHVEADWDGVEEWQMWVQRAVPGRDKAQAILLYDEDRPLSADWPVSSQYACIAFSFHDLEKLQSYGVERFFQGAGQRLLLVEMTGAGAVRRALSLAASLQAEGRTAFLIPEGIEVYWNEPVPNIVAPRHVDDAVERTLKALDSAERPPG